MRIREGRLGQVAVYGAVVSGGPTPLSAFLTRANAVTTLDGTHTSAYTALINGGVSDGWWSKLDVLMIYATQSSGVALLNLVNATYTATAGAGLAFVTDRSFGGNGTTDQLVTTFNPSTATSPNFTQNSAHVSVWSLNAGQSGVQSVNIGLSAETSIFPVFIDNNVYLRIDDNPPSAGFANLTASGLFLGNRDSSTTRQGYLNGVSVGTYGSVPSQAVPNSALVAVGAGGTASSNLVAAISAGSTLNSTDQLNFYNRMRTYMTAVGVP